MTVNMQEGSLLNGNTNPVILPFQGQYAAEKDGNLTHGRQDFIQSSQSFVLLGWT